MKNGNKEAFLKLVSDKPSNTIELAKQRKANRYKINQKFENGELVILDGKFEVIVVEQPETKLRLFTRIKDPENNNEWEVVTNRLEKI